MLDSTGSKNESSRASDDIDPVVEVYKQGVDRTLLRQNLRLTFKERLNKFGARLEFAAELRRAGRAARQAARQD
jgi:hypothetical protein